MNEPPTLEESAEAILGKRRCSAYTLHCLAHCAEVRVVVDADHPGAVLPEHLKGQIYLSYGLNLAIPIPDLRVDARGILATLSFSKIPYLTFIPWEAVRAIAGEGAPDISTEELDAAASRPVATLVAKSVIAARRLRLVGADEVPPEQEEPPANFTGLRLIK